MPTEQEEFDFLKKKMEEAIVYQGYFGQDKKEVLDRQASNCAKLAMQFANKKINNTLLI